MKQVHDGAGEVQPDGADLPAGQQEKGENEGAGPQGYRVHPLEAQAGGHRAHGLEHQVADEQGPAHGDTVQAAAIRYTTIAAV